MRSYPRPKTEQDFETLCLEYLRREFRRPMLALYAKRGEEQFGVDIFELGGGDDALAAQCKLHEAHKTLQPAEVRKEVAKADRFPHAIGTYAVCTTGKKTKTAQDCVVELNRGRAAAGKFTVQLVYWEDIELRLDSDDVLRETTTASSHASVRSIVTEGVGRLSAQVDCGLRAIMEFQAQIAGSPDDAELDRAKRLIEDRQYVAAQVLLSDLRSSKFDRLTSRQRFRCLTYLGVVDFELGNEEASGRLMLQGVEADPTHEKAALNRAHAESLLGRPEAAWEAVQDARRQDPTDPWVSAAYVAYAPPEIAVDELIRHVAEMGSESKVMLALANQFLARGEHAEAIRLAERLKEMNQEVAHAHIVHASALAVVHLPDDPRDGLEDGPARSHVKSAVRLLNEASVHAESERDVRTAVRARLFQCELARLVEDPAIETYLEEGARVATGRAQEQASFDILRAQHLLSRGEPRRAVDYAERATRHTDNVNAFLVLAVALWNRNEGPDRENARRELRKRAAQLKDAELEQATHLVVTDLLMTRSLDTARQSVAEARTAGLDPANAFAQEVRIAEAEGNADAARESALGAFHALSAESSRSTRRFVATALHQAGADSEAIDVLLGVASRSSLTDDTRNLVGLALEVGRHDVVLDWCGSLWESNSLDPTLRWNYFVLLQEYDPTAALARVEQSIGKEADDVERGVLVAQRCVLQQRLGLPVQTATLDVVPPPKDVAAHQVVIVVEALRESRLHAEAARYAYDCLLRFPDEPSAHATLIRTVLLAPGEEPLVTVPSTVQVGCVVEYRETDAERASVVVIERERAVGFGDVVGESEPIARILLGRSLGEEITLAEGAAGVRRALILRIGSGLVHRFNESMNSWQIRFPDVPFLEQGKLRKDPETGELDVSSLLEMLKKHQDNLSRLDVLYKGGAVPMAFLAEHTGRSLFDTMDHLAGDDDLYINCVYGDKAAMNAAVELLDGAKGLLLDGTAIWTLRELGLLELLRKVPVAVGVVQPALDAVREASDGRPSGKCKQIIATHQDDRLIVVVEGAEAQERERDSWRTVADMLAGVSVYGAKALTSLSPKRREELTSFSGVWTAQSIAAASEHGFVLWSDDRVQEFLAREYMSVKRVWTQAVLQWLECKALLGRPQYSRAASGLQARRYSGTLVDDTVVVDAARTADWKLDDPLFARNLKVLGDPGTRLQACLVMALALIRACMAEVALSPSQVAIIAAVMDHVGARDPSLRLAHTILRAIPSALALLPLHIPTALGIVRAWLRRRVQLTG